MAMDMSANIKKDMVLREFQDAVEAYEVLCKISAENLPNIYDAINLSNGQIVFEEFIDGVTVAEVMESGKYHYRGAKNVLSARKC